MKETLKIHEMYTLEIQHGTQKMEVWKMILYDFPFSIG